MPILEDKASKPAVLWEPTVWGHWIIWILLKAPVWGFMCELELSRKGG